MLSWYVVLGILSLSAVLALVKFVGRIRHWVYAVQSPSWRSTQGVIIKSRLGRLPERNHFVEAVSRRKTSLASSRFNSAAYSSAVSNRQSSHVTFQGPAASLVHTNKSLAEAGPAAAVDGP